MPTWAALEKAANLQARELASRHAVAPRRPRSPWHDQLTVSSTEKIEGVRPAIPAVGRGTDECLIRSEPLRLLSGAEATSISRCLSAFDNQRKSEQASCLLLRA
jgi:hypothetical protein